jgi:GxxExxY protein
VVTLGNDARVLAALRGFTTEDTEDTEDGWMSLRGNSAVSGEVIDAALTVHSALGPGLLESAYEACLAHELRLRGLPVLAQVPVEVSYRGVTIDIGYRLDLLVQNSVVVEIKAVAKLLPIHQAQLLSYLRLSGRGIGLLINFHERRLKNGIVRMLSDT